MSAESSGAGRTADSRSVNISSGEQLGRKTATVVDHQGNHAVAPEKEAPQKQHGRASHFWMMLACSGPMVLVFALLTVTGAVQPALLVIVIVAVAAMTLLMLRLHGNGH